MLNSTQQFIERIHKFPIQSGRYLVSFDVTSLFTNVPLQETIDIVADYIFNDENPTIPDMEKDDFIKLLQLATEGMFLYRDKLYRQIDGVAMGSPLGPTLANFVLAHIESKIFAEHKNYYPKLYCRYVDDIFAVFDKQDAILEFLNLLNSQHPNLKFTKEQSVTSLPFLDVKVTINNAGEIETSVWRKSSNTGLMLNFSASCPKFWKTGLISCLLHRAKIICSSQTVFNKEVTKLKRLFFANHYPAWFFDAVLTNFKNHNNKISDESSVEVERLPLFLPYFGQASIQFAKSLKRLCRKKFDVRILPIYQTVKVLKYFQLKSATPKALCSNIVYQFSCACDAHLSYIGMSSRHLSTRAKEHLNLADKRKSAIKDHLYSCDICSNNLDMDSFTVLKKCNSEYETKIHEALLIKKQGPKLNKQVYASGASFLLDIF